MSYIHVKQKLKEKIGAMSDIAQVVDYPSLDLQQFPAAGIRSMRKTASYETTSENYEEYIFLVYLFQPISENLQPVAARNAMEELVDSVESQFNSDEFLTGITLPDGSTFLGTRPTESEIYEEESGKYVIGQISLALRVSTSV